ncbi:hypothetical protein ACFL38_03930 [Candidatus Omnitrophota bacterium]
MSAKELTLNIAVNLGRLGRFAYEKKTNRLNQFLQETQDFVRQLEAMPKSSRFQKTFDTFRKDFDVLSSDVRLDSAWAETAFTWAAILTHRAQLT